VLVHYGRRYAAGMTRQVDFPTRGVAAIGQRLLARVDELSIRLTDTIRTAERFYSGDTVPLDDLRVSVRQNLVHILSGLSGQPLPGLAPPRATGRRRAEQGVPLTVILRAYRVAGRFIWAAVLAEAEATGVPASDLLDAGSELWLIIDQHSGSVTDAYRDAVAERVRADVQTRTAMLDALLRGEPGDGSRLWENATALRLPHEGMFVVVAAGTPKPGVEAVRDADETLRRRGIMSAWRVEVDAHIGVVALNPRTTVAGLGTVLAGLTAGRIGVSEPFPGLDQTPAALRQARLALTTATGDGPQVVRYEQAPVAVVLATAPDAAAALARAVLGPVLALPAAERDLLLETARIWFAEDGATSAAAARLHLHRNTVRYRLRRLEELTGHSLARPTGVAEVHLALEAVRVLRLTQP
jgi:hypothetical protein